MKTRNDRFGSFVEPLIRTGTLYWAGWILLSLYVGQFIVRTYYAIYGATQHNLDISIPATTVIALVAYIIPVYLAETWCRRYYHRGADYPGSRYKTDFKRILFVDVPATLGFSAFGVSEMNTQAYPLLAQILIGNLTLAKDFRILGFALLAISIVINFFYFKPQQPEQ